MVRVGLVGYGFMGKMHSQCYEAIGEAKVVALADPEPERREEATLRLNCQAYPSLEELLASAEVDLVDLCTPTYLHEEQVVAAARARKDILCEKPMSLSLDSCDRMIAAAERAGVKLMVGQVIRFWPEYQVVKKIVDSGRFGRVEWVSARRLSPVPGWAWRGWLSDSVRSGGVILDMHIHDLDYIAYLIGSPKKVQACGVPGPGGGLDSVLTLGWDHPLGGKSYAEGSFSLPASYPFTMALLAVCEKATIKFDSGAAPSLMVYPMEGEPFAPEVPMPEAEVSAEVGGNISALGGYFNEIKYLVDCLKTGRRPEVVTPQSAREAVRLCLAVRESAETGRTVSL